MESGPPPREAPPRPVVRSGVEPQVLDLYIPVYAQDSNRNGFTDTIPARVYFWNERESPAAALRVEGSISFTLTTLDGAPLATWQFGEEEMRGALFGALAGPQYLFPLNVLDKGIDDRVAATDVYLMATFTDTNGRSISNRNPLRGTIGLLR